jgi:hypothetical protein
MAHFVKIASVLFQTRAVRNTPEARGIILEETQKVLDDLKGYNLDLIVFCEGVEAFGQAVDDAEELSKPGPFLETYMDFANAENCHIAASIKLRENGKAYNSIAYIGPEGEALGAYHKNNLTPGEVESGLSSGTKAVAVDTAIGRLSGAVCFDLNFEDIRKQTIELKPDIITFASMYHGGLMQQIWAYQSRSFFVSALPFHGGGILDPFGSPLALTNCYASVPKATVNIDRAMVHLDFNRDKFSEIEKKYLNEVIVDTPPNIGPAIIYSLSEKRTAMDIVEEFELELLDDYFDRSIKLNAGNR